MKTTKNQIYGKKFGLKWLQVNVILFNAGGKEETQRYIFSFVSICSGTEAGLKLYLPEILKICQRGLHSQSWRLKGQAGRAISTIATKLASSLSPEHFNQIMKALVGCLAGRTWTGKVSELVDLSWFFFTLRLHFLKYLRPTHMLCGGAVVLFYLIFSPANFFVCRQLLKK